MKSETAEYNIIEQRQGVVALGLSEYTSRETRKKLVKAIHRKFDEELLDRKRQNRREDKPLRYLGSASGTLARSLGVDIRTVQRWLSGGIQSCNANAERVIQLALKEIPFQESLIRSGAGGYNCCCNCFFRSCSDIGKNFVFCNFKETGISCGCICRKAYKISGRSCFCAGENIIYRS